MKSWCELQPGSWKISWVGGRALVGLPARGTGLPPRSPGTQEAAAIPPRRGGVAGPEAWSSVLSFPMFQGRPVVWGSRPARGGSPSSGARRQSTGSGPAQRCPGLFPFEGTDAARPRGNPGRLAEAAARSARRRESVLQPPGRRRSWRRSRLSRGRRGWGGRERG